MYPNPQQDRAAVEQTLQQLGVCANDVTRLTELGDAAETAGHELHAAVSDPGFAAILRPHAGPAGGMYMGTYDNQAAVDLEAKVAASIGQGNASVYDRLYIGGTDADVGPHNGTDCPNVVHVNHDAEDMWFQASGPRILINGTSLPLPDGLFDRVEGYHIPYRPGATEMLLEEVFRTTRPGAVVEFAPSSSADVITVFGIFRVIGFINVRQNRATPQTHHHNRRTPSTFTVEGIRP